MSIAAAVSEAALLGAACAGFAETAGYMGMVSKVIGEQDCTNVVDSLADGVRELAHAI